MPLGYTTPDVIPHRTDEELFAAFQGGDEQSFAELHDRMKPEMIAYLTRYLGSGADADDVFQNTLIQAVSKKANFDPTKKIRPWLYTIATRKAVDFLRKRNRKPAVSLNKINQAIAEGEVTLQDLLTHTSAPPDVQAEREESRERVRRARSSLVQKYEDVLQLAYDEDEKYQIIGNILGLNVGTVKSRLHNAKNALRHHPLLRSYAEGGA